MAVLAPRSTSQATPLGRSLAEEAFTSGRPVIVDDYQSLADADQDIVEEGIKSVICLPVLSGTTKVGVVTIASLFTGAFTSVDVSMLMAVVDGLGAILENSRLSQQVLNIEQESKAVGDLALIVTSTLNMSQVYEYFASQARKVVSFDRAAVNSIDVERGSLTIKCLVGEALPGCEVGDTFSLHGTLTELAYSARRPIVLDRPRENDSMWVSEKIFAEAGMRSAICIPLYVQGKIVVSFTFRSKESRAFGPREQAILERLCSHIGPSLENSELYQRTKNTEEALRVSNSQLEEALVELKEAQALVVHRERMEALGSMASGIAHDFNNALTPILGYSDLILSQPESLEDTELISGYILRIHTVAKRAAEVVSSIREFYRPREEDEDLVPVDLNALISQTVWSAEAGRKDKKLIDVSTSLAPEQPFVQGSEPDLARVISNLIVNAVDAMKYSGSLRLSTEVRGDMVQMEVIDTGSGMTEEVRRRVTEPFFTTKGNEGSGLGLSIVHGIIERHGGELEIKSVQGIGSSFIIRLPKADPDTVNLDNLNESNVIRDLRILLAEDDVLVRDLIVAYLTSMGNSVKAASNGKEALEMWDHEEFDLVLTDRKMPQLTGDELAAAIKFADPTFPIIMITGYGDIMKDVGEVPKGIDAVVGKPVTRDALSRTISRVIDGKRSDSESSQPTI